MASRIDYKEVLNLYERGYSNSKIATLLERDPHAIGKVLKRLNKIPHSSGRDFIKVNNIDILTGTLLGDASLKYGKAVYPCLSFTHSSSQKEYFFHKRQQFLYLSTGSLNKPFVGSGYCNDAKMLNFSSKYLKCLQELESVFYANRKKIIPIEFLKENFTDRSLAYLFMDDGNINNKTVNLNLQGFNKEDLDKFILFLKERFDIEWTLQKNGKYLRMYLRYKSVNKFLFIVKPYIIDSMVYKLPACHH